MRKNLFTNPHIRQIKRGICHFLLWKLGAYNDQIKDEEMPEDFFYPAQPQKAQLHLPSATWVGHSTFLIQIDGKTFLTDPVWGNYCSPLPLKIFQRNQDPPFSLKDLVSLDYVLISHNHYDHLDEKTVKQLHKQFPRVLWIVPQKLYRWFQKRGIKNVQELAWWEKAIVGEHRVLAVPSQHFSGRGFWDKNQTHWNGYVIETPNKKIYFTGDTGYNEKDFKNIGKLFSFMDLSLIPIGTYSPRKFMQPVHINPEEAVQIHLDVFSHLSLGMHWNTFRLSDEPMHRPPFDLYLAMKKKNLPFETFLPVKIGETINF